MWKACGKCAFHNGLLCVFSTSQLQTEHSHIWSLVIHYLRKGHSLVLTGFGELHAQVLDSHVDPVAQRFHPTGLQITFDPNDADTSDDFVTFCANCWECSLAIAARKIEGELAQAASELQANRFLLINDLGEFSFDSSNLIRFNTPKKAMEMAESFGLPDLQLGSMGGRVKRMIIEPIKKDDEPPVSEMREKALLELKKMLDEAQIKSVSKPEKNVRVFPIIATVLVLLLLVNVAWYLEKNPFSHLSEPVSEMGLNPHSSTVSKDTSLNTVNKADTSKSTEPAISYTANSLLNLIPYLNKTPFQIDTTLVPSTEFYWQDSTTLSLAQPDF